MIGKLCDATFFRFWNFNLIIRIIQRLFITVKEFSSIVGHDESVISLSLFTLFMELVKGTCSVLRSRVAQSVQRLTTD
jgi:hypothetical protein